MNAKELHGICSVCYEHTTVHEACCSRGVIIEGGLVDPDDYCETCGEELNDDVCERCAVPK